MLLFFNVSRGYGFIKDLGSGEKYFFHVTSAPEGITEGDNVTFEIERGTRLRHTVKIIPVSCHCLCSSLGLQHKCSFLFVS